MVVKPCQALPFTGAALNKAQTHPLGAPILLKLWSFMPLAEIALGVCRGERSNHFIRHVFQATLGGRQSVQPAPHCNLEQLHRMDVLRDLCEAKLPYASDDKPFFSDFLHEIVGNAQNVHPSVWNRRVKALFSTQGLCVLAKITERDLALAHENWKVQMQSKDHFEAMVSIHIAASLFRLDREWSLLAAASTDEAEQVELPPTLSKWIDMAHELFVQPKGSSTVKATFLRTLKAVVEEISEPATFNLETTAMARDILIIVDHDSFEEWGKGSDPAVRKLRCKLLEPGIPPAMMANAFCVLLCKNTLSEPNVPTRFIILFEAFVKTILLQSHLFSIHEIKSPEEFVGLLVELLPTSPEEPVSRPFISQCLEVVVSAVFFLSRPGKPTPNIYLGVEWALLLLTALDKRMERNKSRFLASIFRSVVRNLDLPDWWASNMSDPGNPPNCLGMKACPHCHESKRQRLCIRLSSLFTKSASNGKAPIPQSDTVHHTQIHDQMDQATPEMTWKICDYGQSDSHGKRAKNVDKQVPGPCDQTFRSVLDEICNDIQRAAVVHVKERTLVLQNRCDNVEKPLREEREKLNELRLVLKDTEEDLANLEDMHKIVKTEFSHMREGHAFLLQRSRGLAISTRAIRQERETLKQKLSDTLRTMANQEEEFSDQVAEIIRETRREIEDLKFANRGAQMVREEEAEMEELTRQDLEMKVQWLREQLDLMPIELGEQHAKELQILKDKYTGEVATMTLQVSTQAWAQDPGTN